MSSYEIVSNEEKIIYKKKIGLLGGIERYKDFFQKNMSSNCLPIDNKQNIGVSISRIDYLYKNSNKFEYLLWNIDCRRQRASLRSIFYTGAETIIIFISENRIDQIAHYFNELHSQLQDANLIFCIILNLRTKNELIDSYFTNEGISSLINLNNFQFNYITKPLTIFNQISSNLVKKIKHKELEPIFIINFINRDLLFPKTDITDECLDYFDPHIDESRSKKIINIDSLIDFILKLDLDIEFDSNKRVEIKNKKLGTFTIFLKNGNVYYFPRICEKCMSSKCLKLKKAPFFICIEANSESWTNIRGLDQPELLILTKILALKNGNYNNLPKSVLNQIIKINTCDKMRNEK